MIVQLVTNYDDWGGLYVDGKLQAEGHEYGRLSTVKDVLEAINVSYEVFGVGGDNCYFNLWGGRCPDDIEAVKEHAASTV